MQSKSIFSILLITFLFLNSCSVSKLALKNISATFSNTESTVFTGDDDPELIKDALPFTIKLYETLLQKDSTNADLYLSTSKLFTLYAQAFILLPADTLPQSQASEQLVLRKRAKKLLLRAREYALLGLELNHPGIYSKIKSSPVDTVFKLTSASDTAFLYWIAVPWISAIVADRSDLALGMTIKKASALLQKVIEYNDSFSNGAAHEIFAAYLTSIPKAMGGNDSIACEHFNKAIHLSNGKKASPFVTMAGSHSLKTKNRQEMTDLLQNAINIDLQSAPQFRLQNIIYQQRARYMLAHIDSILPIRESIPTP